MGEVVKLFEPKSTPEKALQSALDEVKAHPDRWEGVLIMFLDTKEQSFITSLAGSGLTASQAIVMAEITRDRMMLEMGYRK